MKHGTDDPSTVSSQHVGVPPIPLSTETTLVGDAALIVVAGDLDAHTGDEVMNAARAVVDHGANRLTFDLAGVGFIDSSGLSALIKTRVIAPVTLRDPSDQVRRVIELTGLADALPTEERSRNEPSD